MKTFRQFLTEAAITNPVLAKQDEQSNYYYFFSLMQELSKTSCVAFALYAAKLVQEPQIADCINLVEEWLKNPGNVKENKLHDAARDLDDRDDDFVLDVAIDAALAAANSNIMRVRSYAAWGATYACLSENVKNKLINYLSYLLKKEPEHNNFNHNSLKQSNSQAYSFLERISKLEDWQVTNDDLMGIYHVFDALEEAGMPIDLSEFQWENIYNDVTEKHRLLQTIRREFNT